jgi:hypothetical protein
MPIDPCDYCGTECNSVEECAERIKARAEAAEADIQEVAGILHREHDGETDKRPVAPRVRALAEETARQRARAEAAEKRHSDLAETVVRPLQARVAKLEGLIRDFCDRRPAGFIWDESYKALLFALTPTEEQSDG